MANSGMLRLDNFFYNSTNMESPKKLNDCYFYYYSTCTKGDYCTFRHEPSALGCETVCSFWKEGKCVNVRCSFRHMELRKNRKAIQCYWEQQPGGCLKPHCPFNHQNPKSNKSEDVEPESPELPKNALVVNLEEESDDSSPTYSPEKTKRKRKIQTEEEREVERIQAEDSAQYYSHYAPYMKEDHEMETSEKSPQSVDLRSLISKRINKSVKMNLIKESQTNITKDSTVLSLREIRKRKFARSLDTTSVEKKRLKLQNSVKGTENEATNLNKIVIKTLAEIRRTKEQDNSEEMEVSSTVNEAVPVPMQKESSTVNETVPVPMQKESEETKRSKVRLVRIKMHAEKPAESKSDEVINNVVISNVVISNSDDSNKAVGLDLQEELNSTTSLVSIKNDDILLLETDDIDIKNADLNDEEDILKNIDELLGE